MEDRAQKSPLTLLEPLNGLVLKTFRGTLQLLLVPYPDSQVFLKKVNNHQRSHSIRKIQLYINLQGPIRQRFSHSTSMTNLGLKIMEYLIKVFREEFSFIENLSDGIECKCIITHFCLFIVDVESLSYIL